MKPEEINNAIAEKCGYSEEEIEFGYTLSQMSEPLPDYYNSLDDCAEFERTLDVRRFRIYGQHLARTCQYKGDDTWSDERKLICATAPQRCEAFLRMHNLWKEET